MSEFKELTTLFKNDDIRNLASTAEGIRFLKLRSLSRKDEMAYVIQKYSIPIGNANSKQWLEILFESEITEAQINTAIAELYETERSIRRSEEEKLVDELYKVDSFGWGGLHQNSLEKTIVNKYVKKIKDFAVLNSAVENELHSSMKAYVLASWYNHWTSIIIEDVFKDHEKVLPAVGLIKKVDFFVNGKPFDLKVTYLPEGYVKYCRRISDLKPELTLLKKLAREQSVYFDKNSSESVLLPDLWRKLDDLPSDEACDLIKELQEYRERIIDTCIADPEKLIRWLYENQGERRFDSSNRLFLILVDKKDFFSSWKLKRARPLIQDSVFAFLNNEGNIGETISFIWDGDEYEAESAAVFVVKEN